MLPSRARAVPMSSWGFSSAPASTLPPRGRRPKRHTAAHPPCGWRGAEHERFDLEERALIQEEGEGRSRPRRVRPAEAVAPQEGDLVLAQAEGAEGAEGREGAEACEGVDLEEGPLARQEEADRGRSPCRAGGSRGRVGLAPVRARRPAAADRACGGVCRCDARSRAGGA